MNKIKQTLKEFIPPVIVKAYQKNNRRYGFFGDYSSWEEAVKDSTGYDSDLILNKVRDSMLKVKEGKAVYERDSVLFDRIEYSFPVLAGLLKIATANDGKLSVLDFGGSLGSSYYQCKEFLSDLKELKWSVVEQNKFVECGKEIFENENLKFYGDINNCLKNEKPDAVLLSCVIQYLESPYSFIKNLLTLNFQYIIFDRTPFINLDRDLLTVQKVPPDIYSASYPAWFFNENKFLSYFPEKYNLFLEFDGFDRVNIESEFKGFIFKLKNLC
ncbi:MAG: TIGR04325 family methyltransferase [Xenococcaceae cyanobacterium]